MPNVRGHARRGTRGVRPHYRVPKEYAMEVTELPVERLHAGNEHWLASGVMAESWAKEDAGDERRIRAIQRRLERGWEVDPIVIIPVSGSGYSGIWDGYHRVAAARRVGLKMIPTISKEKGDIRTRKPYPTFYTPGATY